MNNFLKDKTISISILNLTKEDLERFLIKLNDVRSNLDYDNIAIHFDIMDGKFVPNMGVNIDLIEVAKKYNFFVDVHLMCSNPKEYVDKAILLGADNITIHYEIDKLYENLKYLDDLKNELKERDLSIGISIKPDTDIQKITNYLNMCDVILLMTVEPGKGGQKYIDSVNNKIKEAVNTKKMVQIDGGVDNQTIVKPNEFGTCSFVIGSYIVKDIDNFTDKLIKIEEIINK